MRDRWAILLIITAVVVGYLETAFNGFVYDDTDTVLGCELITSMGNLKHLFTDQYFTQTIERSWRPIPTASLFVDHAIFGLWPGGYHLFNTLYHLLACLALWGLLRFTLATKGAPLLGALVFALHPLGTEAVNGISFREDLFVGILTPLALLLGMLVIAGRHGKKSAIATGVLTLLACLSKESGVVIPALLLLWWFLTPGRHRWSRSTKYAMTASLAIAVGLFWLLRFHVFTFPDPAPAVYWGGDRATALWNFPRIFFHYLRVFVWPTGLSADHEWFAVPAFTGASLWLGWIVMGGIALFALSLRGSVPLLGLGLLWYLASLGPVSNIIPIYNPVADRHLYVPMMGLCIVVAWGADRMGDWHPLWSENGRRIGILVAALMLCGLLCGTVWRNHVWSDQDLQWEATLEVEPHSTAELDQARQAVAEQEAPENE